MTAPDKPTGVGNRIAPPRFIAFALLALIGQALVGSLLDWQRGILIGFDAAAIVFLVSCLPLLRHDPDSIRDTALRNDANRAGLLGITIGVTLVVLVAVAAQMPRADGGDSIGAGLIVASLAIAWTFSNSVYALHYAHIYYLPRPDGADSGGLAFPATAEPDYWDFVYFAFTLGMTFQTSDVAIQDARIRRVVTLHSCAAFIFNIGVLAFTINVLGG